ncbi:MAG: RsfS/YbeB/iojap family protein, partial [Actinomycetia bacterium]|nr:RsfS/YbeB/iojap family protein [Actinomycetes bacterium]
MTDKTEQKEKSSSKENTIADSILRAVRMAAEIADDKKADYIKILDMRSRLIITDYFIIISVK